MSIFDRDEFNDRLFFPRRDASPPPAGATDQMIEVDGARLHVRRHASPAASARLLLFHGNGEVASDYDDAAAHFARAGFALAVMDYRGYGRSTGTPTLRTLISDARRVAEAVQPHAVMGRSLGGIAAHELYARPVAGMQRVILESTLFDLSNLIRRRGLTPPARFSHDERATFEPATKLPLGRLPLRRARRADRDRRGQARGAGRRHRRGRQGPRRRAPARPQRRQPRGPLLGRARAVRRGRAARRLSPHEPRRRHRRRPAVFTAGPQEARTRRGSGRRTP
jgi:alpha-beta hydrolase superfamily lysophospholipase